MIGLIQRVSEAEVWVNNKMVSGINKGLLLLVGISRDDGQEDISYIANKTVNLRVFPDHQGNLNKSLLEVEGQLLVVSQFTLLGDTRKGRRPSFTRAAGSQQAEPVYRKLIKELKNHAAAVKEGEFGALMKVKLVNDGPVTLIINSRDKFK
ncbi:MAG: D-aminoacyl-tRNA deacylase [Spirochaetota bacterium]